MLVEHLFPMFRKTRSKFTIKKTRGSLLYSRFESRRMLAGDVRVFVDDGVLVVIGDSQDNGITITQAIDGQTSVNGVDTTINGSNGAFTSNSFESISLFMEQGDDTVSMTATGVEQNLSFYGRAGNDRFIADGIAAYHLHIAGETGNDVFELNNANIRKSAYIYPGGGDNVVSVPSISAGRNFKVLGSDGNHDVVFGNLNVGRKLVVDLQNSNNNVLFAGTTSVGKSSQIFFGGGIDTLLVRPSLTQGTVDFNELRLNTGTSDDSVVFDGNVNLGNEALLDGFFGNDSIDRDLAILAEDTVEQGFENFAVQDIETLTQDILDRLSEAELTTTVFGTPQLV